MINVLHFETLMQPIPRRSFVRVNGRAFSNAGTNERCCGFLREFLASALRHRTCPPQARTDSPDRGLGEYGSVEPFQIRRTIAVSRPLRDALSREALVSFDPSSVKIAPVCNPTDRSSVMSVQVTPLRQRMIDDMAIRNMSPRCHCQTLRSNANPRARHLWPSQTATITARREAKSP